MVRQLSGDRGTAEAAEIPRPRYGATAHSQSSRKYWREDTYEKGYLLIENSGRFALTYTRVINTVSPVFLLPLTHKPSSKNHDIPYVMFT